MNIVKSSALCPECSRVASVHRRDDGELVFKRHTREFRWMGERLRLAFTKGQIFDPVCEGTGTFVSKRGK